MPTPETQHWLKAGIAAVRQGDRAQGRTLLLKVVEADEHNEPAWLWLSAALDDPADQLAALENALTLNPNNSAGQAKAQALRQQLGRPTAPPPGAPRPTPAAPAPRPADAPHPAALPEPPPRIIDSPPVPGVAPAYDALDNDPDQCLYCGKLVEMDELTCPFCKRQLTSDFYWNNQGFLWTVLLAGGLNLQSALVQTSVIGLVFMAAHGLMAVEGLTWFNRLPYFATLVPLKPWLAQADLLLAIFVTRLLMWSIVIGLFYFNRRAAAPMTAVVVTLADLAWAGLGYYLKYASLALALLNGLPAALILGLSVNALLGRATAQVRLRTVLDSTAHIPSEYYRHGQKYAAEGKWALAALHWQKAMVRGFREPLYYKALSQAQIKLGRYRQALRTLRAGAEQIPADPDFAPLIAHLLQRHPELAQLAD